MSYESQLDHESGKLINPTQLCLLLSVVVHLLVLKFGLPTFKFNDDDGKREVSIIELNSEQQARLPDLEPQLKTPDLASLTNPANLPPNLLLPGNADPANLPPLIIPPPPQSNFPPLPPITDITLPPVGNWSNLPLPPQTQTDLDPSDFKIEPIKLPPNLGKVPQPSTKTPIVKTTPNPANTAKLQPPQKQPATKPETEPKTKPQDTPEVIAAQKVATSQQRIASLRQSITPTKEGTSNEEARNNYLLWVAKVKEIQPKGSNLPEEIEIKGTYPRDACIVKLKGSSVFGVMVNTAGEVVALDLLKGSKYPIFNQQANQDLRSRLFKNDTNKPKPYQVEVNYEYDPEICPSLTLPSIRQPEIKQSPQPASVPLPKPATQSKPKPEPVPAPKPATQSKPKPEPVAAPDNSSPSLGDRLRNIPLPDLDPERLKNVPLPEKPDL
ncbi:MAG: hypothetical protein HC775_02130 [Hyellaceae cyanobacterium CSU_1_1]|nr:hypothetical protein [Pleurocapsa sp. CRU_1_2]NJR44691.1 hypothetical protein [Hyellaceae cyanobacterium CSU_1_1]